MVPNTHWFQMIIHRKKYSAILKKNAAMGKRRITKPRFIMIDRRELPYIKNGDKVVLMNSGFFEMRDDQFVEVDTPIKKQHKYILSWIDGDNFVTCLVRCYFHLFTSKLACFAKDVDNQINNDTIKISTINVELAINDCKVGDIIQILRSGFYKLYLSTQSSCYSYPIRNSSFCIL